MFNQPTDKESSIEHLRSIAPKSFQQENEDLFFPTSTTQTPALPNFPNDVSEFMSQPTLPIKLSRRKR